MRAVIEEKAKENITKRQDSHKRHYDKKHEDIPLKVGDWVFVCEVKQGHLTKKQNKWKGNYRVTGFPMLTTCSLRNWQGHKLTDALLTNVKCKFKGLTLQVLKELTAMEDKTYNKEFVQATQTDDLPDLPSMQSTPVETAQTADIPDSACLWRLLRLLRLWRKQRRLIAMGFSRSPFISRREVTSLSQCMRRLLRVQI